MDNNIYNPDFVKNLFDKMSNSYERMNFITSFGFSIRWRRQFLKPLKPSQSPIEILDLMTGMGETWIPTKKKFSNSKLTVLDFSEGMLKYAKEKNSKKFSNQIILLQQDILNNHLPSNHYDIVTCAFGLKTFNIDQIEVLAKETKRILKSHGQFTFVEVSKPNSKILQLFYGFYLGKIIPILGKLFLGNPEQYKMLWKYTSKFENAKNASEIFKKTGLQTTFKSYFHGCATGFYGKKNDE